MPSITSWSRLEPQVRTDNMQTALQARVYDPLWLLTRQWQLGEFQGEDTGSPISAQLRGELSQITRYWPGEINTPTVQGRTFDPRRQPLEPTVEREPMSVGNQAATGQLELRAEAGLHFLRLITRAAGPQWRDFFIRKFSLPAIPETEKSADDESIRFSQMMAQRVPDGALLLQAFRQGVLLTDASLNPVRESLQKAAEEWTRGYAPLLGGTEDNTAWQSQRLEYAFAVAAPQGTTAPSEIVLTAREYYEGNLEWHSFDLKPRASLGAAADRINGQNPAPLLQTLMPAPVSFRGMPAQRFWEFEDATVDFGAIETTPDDFARMLLIEFALAYGNDWFVLPVEIPVGTLCQISSLMVTDTFGERTLIPGVNNSLLPQASAWRMYQNSIERRAANAFSTSSIVQPHLFFLAPTLGQTLEGQALEEVLLVRDEMANLVWGIERTVEGLAGPPVNQRELLISRQVPPSTVVTNNEADSTDLRVYRLATSVPAYWIPFLPMQINAQTGEMRLRRGAMLAQDGTPTITPNRSRILSEVRDLYEEEIPREGIRVTRSLQWARWLDGSTHFWGGRYKEIGRGEASSGLQFDRAEK